LPDSGNHVVIQYGKSIGPPGRELVAVAQLWPGSLASGSIVARPELPPIRRRLR